MFGDLYKQINQPIELSSPAQIIEEKEKELTKQKTEIEKQKIQIE